MNSKCPKCGADKSHKHTSEGVREFVYRCGTIAYFDTESIIIQIIEDECCLKEQRDAALAAKEKAEAIVAKLLVQTKAAALAEVLTAYTCQHTVNEDSDGLRLVDVLSPGNTIKGGQAEIELLADHIAGHIAQAAAH